MPRRPFTAAISAHSLSAPGLRIGAGVAVATLAAAVLCSAMIGAIAAPAAAQPVPSPARGMHELLQIRFAPRESLVVPAAPAESDRLAVLADPPADLAADPDLQNSHDLALLRQADAVQARDAVAQAALWAKEDARMQAKMDVALAPYAAGSTREIHAADNPPISASADDRQGPTPAD